MGLGSLKVAWQRQTLLLGHEKAEMYSVLLLDNRGMGDSDKPLMRYSTSEMARDVLEVLRHVGFVAPADDTPEAKSRRTVHVVGLSLGGMIAQELACLVPENISSLTLCCTAARVEPVEGTWMDKLRARSNLVLPKPMEEAILGTAQQIFPPEWLAAPDDVHLPRPGTPAVRMPARLGADREGYRSFDNNYQRFVAQEVHKRLDDERFTLKGFALQLIAAGWHVKSPEQLADMADKVGRDRIAVIHGTFDQMITVQHGRRLIELIKPGRGLIVEGMGHAPLLERWEWFTNLLEDIFHESERKDGRE